MTFKKQSFASSYLSAGLCDYLSQTETVFEKLDFSYLVMTSNTIDFHRRPFDVV